jgi:hypothetical protein
MKSDYDWLALAIPADMPSLHTVPQHIPKKALLSLSCRRAFNNKTKITSYS